jgi:RNA polymerase sigma-70 factor (ECF subfamily)
MTTPNDNDRFFSPVAEHKGILDQVANGYCRNRDDRGDLIQEIVVQLWQSFPPYEPDPCTARAVKLATTCVPWSHRCSE